MAESALSNEIDATTALPAPSLGGYDSSLIARYPLTSVDDGAAEDVSANGYDGTVNGATVASGFDGEDAADFDGDDDSITIPDNSAWDVGGQLTLSVWAKKDFADQPGIGYIQHDTSDYKWLLYGASQRDDPSFYVVTQSGTTSVRTQNDAMSDTNWHHIVATYDKSLSSDRLKIYIDGTLQGTANGYAEDILAGDEGVDLGVYAGSNYYDGRLAEARVYGRAVSASEVESLYSSPRAPLGGGVSTDSNGDVVVEWSNNDDSSDGGIDLERSTDGFASVATVASDLSPTATSYTDTSVAEEATYQYRIGRNTDHATATSGLSDSITAPNSFLRAISSYSSQKATSSVRNVSLLEDISSYSRSGASSSIRVVDILERVNSSLHPISGGSARLLSKVRTNNSYSNNIASNTSALIDMLAASKSELTTSDSTSDRSSLFYAGRGVDSHLPGISTYLIGIIDLSYQVDSHSHSASSFVYNDRTSLELIDHRVDWDEDKAVWYTNWFPESRILDSEDQLSIRSRVIEESKEPAARVCVQYSRDGSSLDQESEVIELGRDEEVKEIIGIPIDEDGFYRIKIMEYSGYNSIYTLDTAITH